MKRVQKFTAIIEREGNQGKRIFNFPRLRYNKMLPSAPKQDRSPEMNQCHHHSTESGHGRIEIRHCYSVPISALANKSSQDKWVGLVSVGMVICERRLWNKTTREVRYYISSLPADAQVLGDVVRTHWGIENSLHWTVDVTFSEDASRLRTGHSSQNFALLRRIALNQLQRETSIKSSIRMKRYRAAMDNHYAAKVLLA